MIINLNEFGGGSVSPEEIEEIVNENHYTKEESDAIVNEAKAVADEAKAIAESKADVDMVNEAKAVADEAKAIAESKADVDMVNEAKAVADEAKTIAEAKQDELVSGTNIKTINGEDILGEGDIEIKVDAYTKEESDARYVQKEPSNKIWYTTSNGLTAKTTDSTGIASLETMGLVSNEVVGDKCVMTFSQDVTNIGDSTFYRCTTITSIEIPNSVTSIGGGAFRQCASLTSITIPDSITSIGKDAFLQCSSLSSVTIGNSVTSIGVNAFHDCSSLSSITIPNSVTSIGNNAFYGCSSLTTITIPNSVTKIGSFAFDGTPTEGVLYCDEDWFNNLSSTSKSNLYNVANWERKPLPKPIEERVDALETDVTTLKTDVAQLKEDIKDIENRIVILTQEEYEALETKGENTIYLIK